ncbi:MAG: enoyl-CoA hydratase/isomerase family protein, partial [Steroidobacteraceae bacterium]|nr:enoyl-CoA hydratase/isomerase family protein [Steroidobacteraceae bacterium]
MKHVDYALEGNVAVLAFANPPVNSLGFALRRDLVEDLERAIADPAAKAIVLIGAKGTFSAGADIKEFVTGEIARAPSLWHMITAIEMSPKPVVAAIEGLALGGGLELALACHFRVAHKDAKVGLPEVKLGLLPGAGGTQRLPRIIGVEGALNVMLGGTPLPIALFAKSPLFDRVADADLRAAAVAFASDAAARGELPLIRNIRIREPNIEALCQFARNTARTAFAKYPAPLAIVECVYAAATKKFDDGMAEEAKQFRALVEGPESAALRHIFFGERAANRIADVPDDTPLRDIR